MSIPQNIDEITPDWLAVALSSHLGAPIQIASMEFERLGETDSMTGFVFRVRLHYATSAAGGPTSVVVKLPKAREHRSPGNRTQYESEVGFYRHLAPGIEASIPAAYWSEIDAETGDYVLVLEDFPDLRPGSNAEGCTLDEARVLLREMAVLHARWWAAPELVDYPFLMSLESSLDRWAKALPERLPIFLDRHGAFVQSEERSFLEALATHFSDSVAPLRNAPRTLVHGDLAVKNTLRGGTPSDPTYVVIDWQLAGIQSGVRDVSFFIEHSIAPAMRSRSEQEMLRFYHSQLEARGVTGYSLAQLVEDYRRSVVMDMARFVTVGSAPRTTPEARAAADLNVRNAIKGRTGSVRELHLAEFLAAAR